MNNLLHETQEYWRVSSIWNGRLNEPLTMKQGIERTKQILQTVGPKRKLQKLASLLMGDFISPKQASLKTDFTPIPIHSNITGVN